MEQESGEIIVPIDAPSTLTNLRRVTSGRTSVLTGVEKRREGPRNCDIFSRRAVAVAVSVPQIEGQLRSSCYAQQTG